MNGTRFVRAGIVLGLLLGAIVGSSTTRASESASIVDQPRPVMEWGFEPGTLAVPVGEWVTWSNEGQDDHTVTAVDGSFDSGVLMASEGFSWFFDQPGAYAYTCALHPWMKGSVIVGDGAGALDSPDPPSVEAPAPVDEPMDERSAADDLQDGQR